jgi:hypothetical protein
VKPSDMLHAPNGSVSISKTRFSYTAKLDARFTAVVVLPTPPLGMAMAMILGNFAPGYTLLCTARILFCPALSELYIAGLRPSPHFPPSNKQKYKDFCNIRPGDNTISAPQGINGQECNSGRYFLNNRRTGYCTSTMSEVSNLPSFPNNSASSLSPRATRETPCGVPV